MVTESQHRRAPNGFTGGQWETFTRDGFLVLENALDEDDILRYTTGVDRVASIHGRPTSHNATSVDNLVQLDSDFAELIDHPRHVGFAYDLFGELLKLHRSRLILRPPESKLAQVWHLDGPRAVPYRTFSPELPLQLQIGYWLTDMPNSEMGNLVVLPGSHRIDYLPQYDTNEHVPGEVSLCFPRGTITIMHASLWHRGHQNRSDVTRKTIYISYCPAWLQAADRLSCDDAWLNSLDRERRIIMRGYSHGYDYAKPPQDDFPLFLERDGADRDAGVYDDRIRLHRRKRLTAAEKWTTSNRLQQTSEPQSENESPT